LSNKESQEGNTRLLDRNEYCKVQQSQWLPGLDMRRLAECAAIESRVQAVRAFREKGERLISFDKPVVNG
jgi:hypothetical protein